MKTAFIFPGQGAQYQGIGEDLYQQHGLVREVYEEASDVLGYDMAELSFKDPHEQINLTRFTQPVLLTHSTACERLFKHLSGGALKADIVAGHSLGEYSAMVASGMLSFAEGLALVSQRGELMGTLGEGEMQALMIERGHAEQLVQDHNCGLAAANLPKQNVVGGKSEDLDALVEAMTEAFPRTRSVRLKTEGAFHTFYMQKAADEFKQVLADYTFNTIDVEVLSNYTGKPYSNDQNSIREQLYYQLINPVLWFENLCYCQDNGVSQYVEFGGGLGKGNDPARMRANLEGIVSKAFPDAEEKPNYLSVINLDSLEKAVAAAV